MLRKAAAKGLWLTKGAALFGGAVVTLALVFGVATMALGANGSNFILGQVNNTATAPTKLTANVQGPAVQVQNTNPGADDAAIALSVQPGEAPMRVNSTGRVTNLNADKLDGLEPSQIKGAKAYAVVDPGNGVNPPEFVDSQTSGFTDVERINTGLYCLTAPGLNPDNSPALGSVEATISSGSGSGLGDYVAYFSGFGCSGDRYYVVTQNETTRSNNVAFTIAVP